MLKLDTSKPDMTRLICGEPGITPWVRLHSTAERPGNSQAECEQEGSRLVAADNLVAELKRELLETAAWIEERAANATRILAQVHIKKGTAELLKEEQAKIHGRVALIRLIANKG